MCREPGLQEAIRLHSHVGALGLQIRQLGSYQCHFLDWGPGMGEGLGTRGSRCPHSGGAPGPPAWCGRLSDGAEHGECECLVGLSGEKLRTKQRERELGAGETETPGCAEARGGPV